MSHRLGLFLRSGNRLNSADGWALADDRVKQVKDANDIVDVVGGYISLRPVGKTYMGLCPFHSDSRPSFDVDPGRQRYRCWSCDKYGDVISFVQEHEHVSFREALESLARRAGITLEKSGSAAREQVRAPLLDVMRWATREFHECLLDSPLGERARNYVAERGLTGETVRRYGLGYAPPAWDWLLGRAESSGVPIDLLEKVGLIGRRSGGNGFYDLFRDRLQFPIRDVRGQTVGFGGRILPDATPNERQGPKYYNSCETPLFSKSNQLYGIDHARGSAAAAGYLAVVEGYTDVLMAHQMGIGQVVATMGTALNARHVQKLRNFTPRVVLVFDADAGGMTGVDRALQIFASSDIELAIATLPDGLDPCDLLLQQGAEAFRLVLESAVDALEFKLNAVLKPHGAVSDMGIEARKRAVEAVLGIIALAPTTGQAEAVKTQLMIGRIARRLALKEEALWALLDELRSRRHDGATEAQPRDVEDLPRPRSSASAAPEERELLEVLLADPELVSVARSALPLDAVQHPGLRRLLDGLYALHDAGESPTLDMLRLRLDGDPLLNHAMRMQDIGRRHPERAAWLDRLLDHFQERQRRPERQEIKNQLIAASDHAAALDLLRRLQQDRIGVDAR